MEMFGIWNTRHAFNTRYLDLKMILGGRGHSSVRYKHTAFWVRR
jgi:hypothetical protein